MNTHTNSPLLDEYKSEMEVTVAALSLVSAISSLAVVITTLYIIYRERRDGIDNTVSSGARLLNLCFVFSTFVLSIFFIMHPFFSLLGYSLEQHRRMCIIQATGKEKPKPHLLSRSIINSIYKCPILSPFLKEYFIARLVWCGSGFS